MLRFLALSRREFSVLLVGFALTLPAVTARLYSSDEVQYFAYLRSLWFDRDVSFDNEYRYFYEHGWARSPGFHETFLVRTTPAGRRINFATMGCALLWAPFYAVADIGARVARAAGSDVAVDGFSQPYVAAVAYGSAFWGFAALLLSIGAARGITGTGVLAAVIVWLGTPVLFYMYVAPPMSHAGSAFAVALFVIVWLHIRKEWSAAGLLALGASAALMAMVREQDVFFVAGPAVDFGCAFARVRNSRERTRLLRNVVLGGLAFAVAYLPQLLAYQAINGHPGPSHFVTRKMKWASPHALHVLGSPQHGFLWWTPLAALSVVGMGRLALSSKSADARSIAIACLLMFGLQVYISGSVDSWTVAGAFGQRRFVAVTVMLVIGLASLFAALTHGGRRTGLLGVCAVAVWWNIGLMAQFATRMMDRQRLELGRNAYYTFVVLPRLSPKLAYRYLTNRESFYESRTTDMQ